MGFWWLRNKRKYAMVNRVILTPKSEVGFGIYSTQMKNRDLIIAKSAECTDVWEHFERMQETRIFIWFQYREEI
jgi:hypothetical protein